LGGTLGKKREKLLLAFNFGTPSPQKKFYAISKLGSTLQAMYSKSHVVRVPVVP